MINFMEQSFLKPETAGNAFLFISKVPEVRLKAVEGGGW